MKYQQLNNISYQLLKYWLSNDLYKNFEIFKCYITLSKVIHEINNSATKNINDLRDG